MPHSETSPHINWHWFYFQISFYGIHVNLSKASGKWVVFGAI